MSMTGYQRALDEGWPAVQAKVDEALTAHAEGLRQAVTIRRSDTILVDFGTREPLPDVGAARASRKRVDIMSDLVLSVDVPCCTGEPTVVYDPEPWVSLVQEEAVTLIGRLGDVEDALLRRQVPKVRESAKSFCAVLDSTEPRHLVVPEDLSARHQQWVEELRQAALLLTCSARLPAGARWQLWVQPQQVELWINADWSLSRDTVREERHEPGHASAGQHKAYTVTLTLEATLGARVNPIGRPPRLHVGRVTPPPWPCPPC